MIFCVSVILVVIYPFSLIILFIWVLGRAALAGKGTERMRGKGLLACWDGPAKLVRDSGSFQSAASMFVRVMSVFALFRDRVLSKLALFSKCAHSNWQRQPLP